MRFALIIIVLVVALGGGAFGLLVYNGTIRLGPPKPVAAKPREIPTGATLVPWSVRALPANTLMTRELLSDAKSGRIVRQPVFLDSLKGKEVMTDAAQIVGRVLRKDKRVGYVFTEADFYPKGTRPGLTAAIPAGKRSVTLEAAKLTGARSLKAGDRVDLLAAQSYDPSKKPILLRGVGAGNTATADPPVKQAMVKVLAQDGVVIAPLTIEEVPYANTGTKTKTKPLEEIEIAVDPEEVPGLMEAIAAGAEISCVVHSGQPEKPEDSERLIVVPPPPPAPEAPVVAPITTVETIIGRKHQILAVPSAASASASDQRTVATHAAGDRQGGQP